MHKSISSEVLNSPWGLLKLRVDSFFEQLKFFYENVTVVHEESFDEFQARMQKIIEQHSYSMRTFVLEHQKKIGKEFNTIGFHMECAMVALIAFDKHFHELEPGSMVHLNFNDVVYFMGYIIGVAGAVGYELNELTNNYKKQGVSNSVKGAKSRNERFEQLRRIVYRLVKERVPTNGWQYMSHACKVIYDDYLECAKKIPEGKFLQLDDPNESDEDRKVRIKRRMYEWLSDWAERDYYFKPKSPRKLQVYVV